MGAVGIVDRALARNPPRINSVCESGQTMLEPRQCRRMFLLISVLTICPVLWAGCSMKRPLKAWKSDPSLAASLDPEFQVEEFMIHPPHGFTFKQSPMTSRDGFGQVCVWTGPKHPNGQSAELYLVIGNDGGNMTSHVTSEQVTRMYLGAVASQHLKSSTSAIQSGSIGGMDYARGYWTGFGKQTHQVFHGAVYATSSAPYIIQARLIDSEPYDKKEIPVLEASLQTLRKL
jgi:hypothetical protein